MGNLKSKEGGHSCPPAGDIRGLENPRSNNFYNPYEPVERSAHHLPHREQGQIFYFVTWRLSDSLPGEKLLKWKKERDFWLASHPKPWNDETEIEFHNRFSATIDGWLDSGEGTCILRYPRVSEITSNALLHFDGERYSLDSFVIMPNHVHVIFAIIGSNKLSQIIKTWKGFTTRKTNELLTKSGEVWQDDYWDRMLRSEKHLEKCREYIVQNPGKANLHEGEYRLLIKEKKRG